MIATHLGLRDEALLESALARPRQVFTYQESATLSRLAAAYAFGLAKNRAFFHGNKRVAWVVCALFLELNGRRVLASQSDVVTMILGIADGSVSEESFAAWLEQNSR